MNLVLKSIGWIGTSLVLGAFFLNTSGIISPADTIYPLMNLIGAMLLGIEFIRKRSYSGLTLQTVWALIAVYNLFLLIFR